MAEIDALTLDRLTVAGLKEHQEITSAELRTACERYTNGHHQFRAEILRHCEVLRAIETLLGYYGGSA